MMTAGGFIVDTMLGTLATWLRLIGYDTHYDQELSPKEMIAIALSENRIILTKSKQVANTNTEAQVYRITETTYIKQLPAISPPSEKVMDQPQQVEETTPDVKEVLPTEDETNYITVKSPIIGTFYRKSSPDQPSFVEVGDTIKEGDVLCVIEAMKLFNEIESEVSGKIIKVLIDDASPVEFDQPLFLIDPS